MPSICSHVADAEPSFSSICGDQRLPSASSDCLVN
jgi:hypothetical protein